MTTNMAESSGSTETGNGIGNEAAMCRNVSKLIVSPPGFNGLPKRGHLIFDACFESGNLGRVDYISDFEYDLFIRPDTCNPRFRVWFNFTVENTKENQRVLFNIVNFSKTKSLYRDGMSPVVKSTSRPKWQRLPSKNVYYYRCPDHRKNYVMSFAFCFDREDDVYQFAYCYPYTYTRLQHYLENLDRLNLDYVHRELLGLSVQQRRLDLLTITSPVSPWNYRSNGIHGSSPVAIGPETTDIGGTNEGFTMEMKTETLELCEPEPEIQKPITEEANTSSFYPPPAPVLDKYILENGKVHLGSGVWVNEEKWHQLQATQGDSKYTKNLAVMIWGTDVLKNRSVTGVATKKKKDASPKPPLSPHKLSVIRVNLVSAAEQRVVFITARVHPGETPSSFVCQGIIDFLVSQHPTARSLRDHLIFKIAPMLNPDGVYLGNYRCSLMGFDLNRHWQDPSPWAHPTLYGVKQLILEMHNSQKSSLEFYIDIHAHSTMMNGFMYGNIFEQEELFQRQAIFPKMLCRNAEDFSFSSTSFNRDTMKAGTGRRFLGGLLDNSSYCYTLEVSFYSYMLSGTISAVPYTEEAYMKLGRNVARTFLDYYRLSSSVARQPAPTLRAQREKTSAASRTCPQRAGGSAKTRKASTSNKEHPKST
ncbi:cytosolic carboxypeptidase 6-like isoform 3-T3 [Anomaloglossus baeobatrachus]|uniref:cytosolic carboxypeptidase 6-like isoform X3 n=1 Tax=Anomaloglossus baeobatrachus TaxID=238106 RepID=UPI003F4FB458